MKKLISIILGVIFLFNLTCFTACQNVDNSDNPSNIEEPDNPNDSDSSDEDDDNEEKNNYATSSQVSVIDSETNKEIVNNKITVCEFYSKQIQLVADESYELPPNLRFRSSNPAVLAVDDTGTLFYISKGQAKLTITDDKDFTKVINVETTPLVTVNNAIPLQVTASDGLDGIIKAVITEVTYDQNGIYVSGNVTSVTGTYIGSSGWWLTVSYSTSTGAGGSLTIGNCYYKTGDSFYKEKIIDIKGKNPITITLSSRR